MLKYGWACLFILVVNHLFAQSGATDSAFTNHDPDYAKQLYFTQRGEELAIYNGHQQDEYPASIEGHAYFLFPGWQEGSVTYDGILYEHIILKYDLLKDQVVVAPNGAGGVAIALFSPRVAQFSFGSFHFIRIDKGEEKEGLPAGFYQELVSGKLTALAKRTKAIDEKIISGTLNQKFEEKEKYYLFMNGIYYSVKNKESILSVVRERKKEVQEFISANDLNYRKAPEQMIMTVAEFYNKSGY